MDGLTFRTLVTAVRLSPVVVALALPVTAQAIAADQVVRGDFNIDGIVSTEDINAFIVALTDLNAWEWDYADRAIAHTDPFGMPVFVDPSTHAILTSLIGAIVDPNQDSEFTYRPTFTTEDINPFVQILTGSGRPQITWIMPGGGPVVPEPASLAMLGIGWLAIARRRP